MHRNFEGADGRPSAVAVNHIFVSTNLKAMWQFRDEEGRRRVRHDLMSRREGLLADEQPDESTLRESTQTVEVTDAVFFSCQDAHASRTLANAVRRCRPTLAM